MRHVVQILRKEFNGFFASPAAWLFLGAFLLVNLFVFFWAEAFFARNIADLKPLFQWMPILLIFLVAALSMRSWSEERRSGTLESLLTSSISPLKLILGKFFANLSLVAVALILTLPLAFSVANLGQLDIGPVVGAYLASLFLASAYVAIGLYMSVRTDNPIVALILTVTVTGVFYLLGSDVLTGLFGHDIGGILSLLGSGSRFDSITRGVLDIRDIYYYLSITGVFLILNLFSIERLRWANNPLIDQKNKRHHRQWQLLVGLMIFNLVLGNFWLKGLTSIRVDLTEDKIYSLSATTQDYMAQLQEPLLIRGYFTNETHPLLKPLVPQIKNLIEEYQVLGGNQVQVEFLDPHSDEEIEREAAEKYQIQPVSFNIASRHQETMVSSYFNLVIAYGDQHEMLPFNQLIQVKSKGVGSQEYEVILKNPEYAITQAIKKVVSSYQSGGNIFANLKNPIQFEGYISAEENLPEVFQEAKKEIEKILAEFKEDAGDKLEISFKDPDAGGGALGQKLQATYGLKPQITSLADPQPFWFYMLFKNEGEGVLVSLPEKPTETALRSAISSAVQRMSSSYLKTLAISAPKQSSENQTISSSSYQQLLAVLGENLRIKDANLSGGQVPTDADFLLVMGASNLNEKSLFAIDQFLMKGGSVAMATSAFNIYISQGGIHPFTDDSGLEDWLKHHGIKQEKAMVIDPQSTRLPIPEVRFIGQEQLKQIRILPYPHFADLRGDGINSNSPITANLQQITMNWASPIDIDTEKNKDREVTKLLHSSRISWASPDQNVMPDYSRFPDTGFEPSDKRERSLLAVAIKGSFDSYFKDKPNPLLKVAVDNANANNQADKDTKEEDKNAGNKPTPTLQGGIIERSSDSARLTLISSSNFASNGVVHLISQGQRSLYTQHFAMLQNIVDWSLEDAGLLEIRGRAQFARTLKPIGADDIAFWEYLNYALALLGLLLIWAWRKLLKVRQQVVYQKILAEV